MTERLLKRLPGLQVHSEMGVVGVLYHPYKDKAETLAHQISGWLESRGQESWVAPVRDEESDDPTPVTALAETTLLVVLGGDGSTLRAARLAAPFAIPIFGINMGRVGFLSEAAPDDWQERLAQVLHGDYWLEQRLMLQGRLRRDGQTTTRFVALNDIVVGRGAQARVLRLHLYVDNDLVTTYTADGIIVATPTGSTAYAMAAGGPLLPPQLLNFLVVPVAPHLSLDRAVILHEEAIVTVQVEMDHEATVAADGQLAVALQDGDRVIISKHNDSSWFVRVGSSSYFYHRLMERLGYWHHKGAG